MFLKTLTLKGFKSFADTTAIELEPGITVVVGPNGSGKSNVVDAVAWVLGAQGPRTLRSSKMDDVIFAGTSARPALGRAEVHLTIDNGSGMLPIELSEVTLSRTLFRTGESEYAINGVPCRLLDIQELLSDSGVGRHQHVIVSQGHLDAVLNARPEDRRAVIEEAAGVLKYRRRKEKAERRLESTEGNLVRLQDLLREVRRQLRPLERQAEAARRHGDLVAELTALRLHLAGRELASLAARRQSAGSTRERLEANHAEVRAGLRELDASVAAAETELSSAGGGDVGDALVRVERLREQARGLAAVLSERRRGIERDRDAFVDRAVVATLEAEAHRLRTELAEIDTEAAALAPQADRLAATEAELAADRAAFDHEWSTGAPAPGSRAAEVRGELSALRGAVERADGERARLDARLAGLVEKAGRLAAEAARLAEERAAAAAAAAAGHRGLEEAEAGAAAAAARVAEAERDARAADAEQHAWEARAEALALALDEARARAGVARLAEVPGVLGTLVDLVEVDEGWEPAFEAAAGSALAAAVVSGADAGRRAVDVLASAGSGAVLVLGADLPVAVPPPVGESVRAHVRAARPDVDRLLDIVVGAAVAVDGWVAGVDAALSHPGAVIVTRGGDRFAPQGWQVGAAGSGATAAALDEARHRGTEAATAAATAAERLRVDREAERRAAALVADLGRTADAATARVSATEDASRRLTAEQADVQAETDGLAEHLADLSGRLEIDRARLADLDARLPGLEAEEKAALERGRALQDARAALEERAAAVGALRTDLEVRAAGLEERRAYVQRRLGELEARLARDSDERARAESLRGELDARLVAVDRLAGLVGGRLGWLDGRLATLREERRRQSDTARRAAERLDGLRRDRQAAERRLEEVRDDIRRSELEAAELALREETAIESLRRDLDCEPERAMAAECPPLPAGVTAAARTRELERELRLMGPVNPLALEEFTALQERNEFLEGQLEDVKRSRRELSKVIRAVDDEIAGVFAAAYADVSENFSRLFETLFPGGQGRLGLTDPTDPLNTGIEVEARPSGKNVRKLSLLSGGERALTALAFLFAVFRSRPSPFYLLDEVEAALDDVNLHRFLDLVEEFRREAQLMIVTHQKRTMEIADLLYGVTMQPAGSSKVVSERLRASA